MRLIWCFTTSLWPIYVRYCDKETLKLQPTNKQLWPIPTNKQQLWPISRSLSEQTDFQRIIKRWSCGIYAIWGDPTNCDKSNI